MSMNVTGSLDAIFTDEMDDLLGKTDLKKILDEMQEKSAQEALSASALSPGEAVISNISEAAMKKAAGQNSIMSQNLLDPNSEESRYVSATMASFSAQEQVKNSEAGSLADLMPESVRAAAQKMGSRRAQQAHMMKETTEAHEKTLGAIRSDMEARTQDAVAPKDEHGNRVPAPDSAPAAATTDASPKPATPTISSLAATVPYTTLQTATVPAAPARAHS